jgi:predicted acyl esterase
MVGVSYFGAIQPVVAATRPPHLKAIMPWNAPADFYRECTYHGGILQTFFTYLYRLPIRGRMQSVVVERSTPDELAALVERFAADPDLRQYPDLYNLVVNPDRVPGFFDIVVQPFDGPFYRERSPNASYDDITIPAYLGSGWWAYGHMHLRGAFENFVGLPGPTKLYIEGRTESPAPLGDEYNAEVVRWYDHWLKGVENGVMDEPTVKLEVRGGAAPREAREWPIPGTQWTELFLRRWQRLAATPEPEAGSHDSFTQQPVTTTHRVATLEYLTEPLQHPIELTGPAALTLYAAIDAHDTNWIVALADVAPDGRSVELTRGFLKASHRAVDAARSKPWLPYHPHDAAERVEPGEVHEYLIDLSPLANVFHRGHAIKLTITCLDHAYWPPADLEIGGANHMPWHVARSETVTHHVFHDRDRPSRLLLPVVPAKT